MISFPFSTQFPSPLPSVSFAFFKTDINRENVFCKWKNERKKSLDIIKLISFAYTFVLLLLEEKMVELLWANLLNTPATKKESKYQTYEWKNANSY